MTSQQVDLCLHNQTGFCKFKDKCPRRHENTICENTEPCNKEKCSKRHPKVCKHFRTNESCRHGENCAYKHKQNDGQIKLYEQVTLLLLKHEKDITSLKEEVNELKNIVQQMAQELVKTVQKGAEIEDTFDKNKKPVNINDTKEDNREDINEIKVNKTQMSFQCEECEFTSEKQETLMKHKNTKHTKVNSCTGDSVTKAATDKEKFHCDECNYSCLSKKSLKKHRSQKHEISQNTKKIECDKCELTFHEQRDLQSHVEEKHCSCTEDTVCDECLNYWVHKSQ